MSTQAGPSHEWGPSSPVSIDSSSQSKLSQPERTHVWSPLSTETVSSQNSLSSTSMNNNFSLKSVRLRNVIQENEFVEIENAFSGNLRTYFYKNTRETYKVICLFLINLKWSIINILNTMLSIYGTIKFNLLVECTYKKLITEERKTELLSLKIYLYFLVHQFQQ